ncbi:cell division protein FtsQ/DivIB [Cytobacillus purgationiresistens]|uniref:Cell division protein DivIB n=1 Tax=Cytobacillus purgationiresistens TaxID=863449 RepID=A0ABU0AH07_9BACI|nr:FtsQ-type POTRA domain-containing protein [Cytobacillus purgationiresistens]MDQ0270330.1 cell division protein FtsQ [Cytobacillus purgationiresistens]
MEKSKVVSLEDRIPKLKQQRKKKANKRLIFLLLLFFILIVFVIYFQSPLSNIKKIEILGNNIYSKEEIIKISGINDSTNIWKVDKKEVINQLKGLPEMQSAEVKIQFPNTVSLEVSEYKRMAYIMKDKGYLPVLENGKVLDNQANEEIPANAPILIGFSEGNPLETMIQELESLPEEVQNSISEIHHTPKKTDKYHITLYMNDGFEVIASLRSFAEKMTHYPSIIAQLDGNQKGVIDLEVGSYFKPYKDEGAEKDEEGSEDVE